MRQRHGYITATLQPLSVKRSISKDRIKYKLDETERLSKLFAPTSKKADFSRIISTVKRAFPFPYHLTRQR